MLEWHDDEVLALASGADAELVLWAVAEVFAFQPSDHKIISGCASFSPPTRALIRRQSRETRKAYIEILRDIG